MAGVNGRDPETDPRAFLGAELRRARVAAGFSSQDALAARLGFDRTVITKTENGSGERAMEAMNPGWQKSSYSGNGGNCVEVARIMPGAVGVRDSKDPQGPVLVFTPDEWQAFAASVKAGESGLG